MLTTERFQILDQIDHACDDAHHLRSTKQYSASKARLQAILTLYRASNAQDPPRLAAILNELANTCFCRRELAEAELHYREALKTLTEFYDPNHARLTPILDHMARLYITQDRFKDAQAVSRRSLEIKQNSLQAADHATLESMRMCAIIELQLRNYSEAEALLKEAIAILEPSTIGPFEEFVYLLAKVHEARGENDQADASYRKTIEVFEQRSGRQWRYAKCISAYADFLRNSGKAKEADELLAKTEDFRAMFQNDDSDDLPNTSLYQPLIYPVTIFH